MLLSIQVVTILGVTPTGVENASSGDFQVNLENRQRGSEEKGLQRVQRGHIKTAAIVAEVASIIH